MANQTMLPHCVIGDVAAPTDPPQLVTLLLLLSRRTNTGALPRNDASVEIDYGLGLDPLLAAYDNKHFSLWMSWLVHHSHGLLVSTVDICFLISKLSSALSLPSKCE